MWCLKTKLLDAGLSEGNLKISSLKPKTNVNLSLSKTSSWPSIAAISHKNHGLLLLNTLSRTNWRKVRTEISFNVTMHLCTQSRWNFATNRLRSGCLILRKHYFFNCFVFIANLFTKKCANLAQFLR